MAIILRTRKKGSVPPGSIVHVGTVVPKIHISILDYDKEHYVEKDNASPEECLIFMNSPTVTWINIRGVSDPNLIEIIGHHFKLHPLLLEDVIKSGQRSKLDDYTDYLFVVMRQLSYHIETESISDEQVSLVLGKNYVISFLENTHDLFDPIRVRIRADNSRIRNAGADYLYYALIDSLIDNYFVTLEAVDRKLEDLEETLMHNPKPGSMRKIQHLKREILLLRKAVWPMREVLSHMRRLDSPLISASTLTYLHDAYDHTIQAIETIDSFRDISSGMMDIHLSNMSQRMNEVMKVLTVVATIFVPLTFIASIYGMNFDYMPELHWRWGYPVVLAVMLVLGIAMLYYFRRRRWI